MRKGCLAAVALFVLVVVGSAMSAVVWSNRANRVGTFSYVNYERILPGMSVADVEQLLGGPGTEVSEQQLPQVVDWSVPLDHPKRRKAVVTGERYIRWNRGISKILVSLRAGVVAEKWYWEPSL